MEMDDADFMLEMKNYPETIQYAILTEKEITKEDHYKWLEENLQYFQVIEGAHGDIANGLRMVGAIRIKDYEISIWVDRGFWKKGIATYILQYVSKRGMTAKIVPANIASMRAFIRAGFEPVSFHETYYTFKKY